MNLELRNVKINKAMSEETNCFSADVWADGVKSGVVSNHGHGGCNRYHWINQEIGKKIEDFAKEQKTEFEFEKLDQLISDLFVKFQVKKDFVRWTKKSTLFHVKGDKKESWRTIKTIFTLDVKKFIQDKYGDQLELIMNEDLDRAVAFSMEK